MDPVGVVTEVPGGLVDGLGLPDDLEAHLARPSRPVTSTTFGCPGNYFGVGSLVGYRVWVMGWPGVGRRNSASQRRSSGCPGMAVICMRVGLSSPAPNASISARRSGQGGSGVSGVSSW